MSSQNAGRQSPDPERQTGSQQQDVPGSGKIDDALSASGASRPAPESAQQQSEKQKQTSLQSNPVHPLERAEEAKYAK